VVGERTDQSYSLRATSPAVDENGAPIPGKWLPQGEGEDATPDADGRVTFQHLLAGRYILSREDIGAEMEVEVPAPGEVRYAPDPFAPIAAEVDDEDGPLARAGVRTGDVVVALDDAEVKTEGQLRFLAFVARGRADLRLGLLRDGAPVEVRVSAQDLLAGGGVSWDNGRHPVRRW
jgi:hypothetical protein